jgi:predicted transcriptional regulator
MADLDARAMLKELKDIKMLLVLQLVTAEVKQRTIAQFLGVSEATVSRMLPAGVSKRKGRAKASSLSEGGTGAN